MENYSEWLYLQLDNDGIIDTSETSIDEITDQFLLECTDLEVCDLDNYRSQFEEHCQHLGVKPNFDVPED